VHAVNEPTRTRHRLVAPALAAVIAVGVLGACSSDGSTPASSSSTTETKPAAPLKILVTNDDGYEAPGIDAVTQALTAMPDVEVEIVAPATNQSGSGSKTTPGGAQAAPEPVKTAGGLAATAVVGFPADSVLYALDTMGLKPDVVVSGINVGQNLGAISEISGTVGAAKQAAQRGIPAIAASQGLGDAPRYDVAADLVVDWVEAHRKQFLDDTAEIGVVNLNVPTCPTGSVRGVKQVPLATTTDGAADPSDCASTVTAVTTDIEAFLNGFASVSQLTQTGATVTSSTTFPPTKPST
jgi:5'-nucleotidase